MCGSLEVLHYLVNKPRHKTYRPGRRVEVVLILISRTLFDPRGECR